VNRWRTGWMIAATATVVGGFSAVTVGQALAHGSMQNPISRTYECYLENPEHPTSAACQAAVALGGTQPLYDWNEVHLLDANGHSRDLIPDGRLCSAGLDKYKGFDLARADWTTSTLPASGPYTFQYKATAPHRGTFSFYVTKNGYDPTKPLKWSDLEDAPFLQATDPALDNGSYIIPGTIPAGHTGRALIYSIWQRSDSPEAFYTCSDVVFGTGRPSPGPSGSPSTSPPPKPGTCTASGWLATRQYNGGDLVSFNGHTWKAQWWNQNLQPGTDQVWVDQGTCTPTSRPPQPCTAPVWDPSGTYLMGNQVAYGAHTWQAKWWTRGDQPGASAVWDDLGPC
jgi:predicted carbohydrate-binding protein with CBM5 and CBM33 domain